MTTAARKKPQGSRKRLWWWLVPALLVGAVLVLPKPTPPTQTLETVQATRGVFEWKVSGSGTLQATAVQELRPEVTGTVTALVAEGTRVKPGEVLLQLDAQQARNDLETARGNLQTAENNLQNARLSSRDNQGSQQQAAESARVNLNNAQRDVQAAQETVQLNGRLLAVGGVSQQALQDARTALQKAKDTLRSAEVAYRSALNTQQTQFNSNQQSIQNALLSVQNAKINLQGAELQLEKHTLKAPLEGQVLEVTGTVGAASSGVSVQIGQDETLELPMQVDETGIRQVKVGDLTTVTLDAFPGEAFTGKVSEISPKATLQQNIPVFYVKVQLPNPQKRLRPGMSAQGEIVVQSMQNALIIPKKAVKTLNGTSTVEVKLDDTRTESRTVKVTEGDGMNVVVLSGLQGQENLVLPERKTSRAPSGGLIPPNPGVQ